MANTGNEPSVAVDKVKQGSGDYSSNAAAGMHDDMIETGILDPVKITHSVLRAVASIDGPMIATEAMVAEIMEDKPAMGGILDVGSMGGVGGVI